MYKAVCEDNGKIVAIKVMDLENPSIDFNGVRNEMWILRLCDDSHVLPCYCCFCVGQYLWLVTPFMEKGSLLRILNIIRGNKDSSLVQGFSVCLFLLLHVKESVTSYLVHEIAAALAYLHNSSLLHL